MRIKKFRSNYALIFVLVTAFLAMQLTTTHAHLSDHRQNENINHQHQIKAHTHSLGVHHTETIDFSHSASNEYAGHEHVSHDNIIEFDFEARSSKRGKHETPLFIVAKFDFQSLLPSALTGIKIPLTNIVRLDRPYHFLHNPRAPPKTS